MSRIFVALSLFLAASVGFATPARAQYNAPGNQYDMQRGPGGGYDLPASQNAPQDIPQQPLLDTPSPQDIPYQIDRGCPSCR